MHIQQQKSPNTTTATDDMDPAADGPLDPPSSSPYPDSDPDPPAGTNIMAKNGIVVRMLIGSFLIALPAHFAVSLVALPARCHMDGR